MQKKLYIGTNTKMYKTIRQTVAFLDRLGSLTRDIDRSLLELFVMPSYTALDARQEPPMPGTLPLGRRT